MLPVQRQWPVQGVLCVRRGRTCTNCAPGRNGRCENVDAIPSGATTVDPRPELVVVANEPAAGEDLMSEVWGCEACVGDQAAGNVREENMSEGALLPNNDSPSADSEMWLLPNNHAQAAEFEMKTPLSQALDNTRMQVECCWRYYMIHTVSRPVL